MALYDYIKIDWSDGCNIGNLIYETGFSNTLYFDKPMQPPTYEIEDEGKKVEGESIMESQVWVKRYTTIIECCEAVADVLSLLPLHETVNISDKDGNVYNCNGADVTVEVSPATVDELITENRYPIMIVKLTFNAHQINKTACCAALEVVECSATLPTISSATEVIPSSLTIEGISPEGMLVRLYERDWLEAVEVEAGGKVNDICVLSELIAYCCTNAGNIYKSIDGGNVWNQIYAAGVVLNAIQWDGGIYIFAVGNASGGDGLSLVANIANDIFVEVATPINDNLMNVSAYDGSAYAVSINGYVIRYDFGTGVWSDVTPVWALSYLYDVSMYDINLVMVCGGEYYACTVDGGVNWTVYNEAGKDFRRVQWFNAPNPTDATWFIGDNDGGVWVTQDNGVNIVETVGVLSGGIRQLSRTVINSVTTMVIGSEKSYIKTSTGLLTGDTYKQRGLPVMNNGGSPRTATELIIMTALGTGEAGTTETPYTEDISVTAETYNDAGMDFAADQNVTYQVYIETYTFMNDPCAESETELGTT